ncbi:MAG: calcium/sodium antiporter [Kiritimatiellae bacterium]|nr:calcium/sodium antiporter [Kiritimatiellia bacterium]
MYADIPLWLAIVFLLGGLYLVAKSADLFIDSASTVATALGVKPFIIGMVVIGFGTSAPELCVSALSGLSGHSDVSLGNAYGSCSFNIALILGLAAMIRPISVKPSVSFVAVPVLVLITLLSCLLVGCGGGFSRVDGLLELGVFAVLLPLYCWFDQKSNGGRGAECGEIGSGKGKTGLGKAILMLLAGLAGLVGSSHLLVWGAVDMARAMGVSELLIGLTIIAAGTSLPELASAVVSARKGEHEFVLGNIIGSNLFNTLAVVGLAGSISPFKNTSPYILSRDLPTLVLLSLSISAFGVNLKDMRQPGRVGRVKGFVWLVAFVAYLGVMLWQECR